MNRPSSESHDDDNRLPFLERVSRYQDGLLSPTEAADLTEEIRGDPARQEEFIQWQIQSAAIYDLHRRNSPDGLETPLDIPLVKQSASGDPTNSPVRRKILWTAAGALVAMLIALTAIPWFPARKSIDEVNGLTTTSPGSGNVLLVEEVRANFVGSDSPTVGSFLTPRQNYFLAGGLINLVFPGGATTIIEAPAMFRIRNEHCLVLEIGSCSVHAPAGAEGFRVITPTTDIVDRGTRFSVKVHDDSETEVHVVEGIAELNPVIKTVAHSTGHSLSEKISDEREPIQLYDRQAIRIGAFEDDVYETTRFNPKAYRNHLPDRIIRYEATKQDGLADELSSVTVQRGGKLRTYSVDKLIPIEVTWFHGDSREEPERSGHLAGGPIRPERPRAWMENRKLHTGFMNIGGQVQPLESDPVMTTDAERKLWGTPGLGVRFRVPVVNRPGPDVVLFDVQHFLQTLDGDPFHVSPIHFRPGLKSLTVRKFDLTVNSPESLVVVPFWRHRYSLPITSLTELGMAESQANLRSTPIPVQAIAVGIDLSDLGFAEGEEVRELFFQHAMVEADPSGSQMGIPSKVDPVFIGGFPE